MFGSRYMGYNFSPLDSRLEEAMKNNSSGKKTSSGGATSASTSNAAAASPLNQSSNSVKKLNTSNKEANNSSITHSLSSSQLSQTQSKKNIQSPTPHALLTFKNNLFGELTRAIQLVILKF